MLPNLIIQNTVSELVLPPTRNVILEKNVYACYCKVRLFLPQNLNLAKSDKKYLLL